jgi:DnaJ family protein A protein 5
MAADRTQGFYNTFSTLFSLLSADEVQWSSPHLYPSFPLSSKSSEADLEDLRRFYSTSQNFNTEKDFAWLDQYRVEEGMPRWQRRDIEKENGRARAQGKREYNETVRVRCLSLSSFPSLDNPFSDALTRRDVNDEQNLVLFVRRRDPRYSTTDSSAARAAAALEVKASLAAAAVAAAAEREANAAAYAAQDWQQVEAAEKHAHMLWDEVSEEGEEESEEEERVEWCEACEKGFRSGGAWENHERSRKHQKNVERCVFAFTFLPAFPFYGTSRCTLATRD